MNRESDRPRDKRYASFLLLSAVLLAAFFVTNQYKAISYFFAPTSSDAAAGTAAAFPGFPMDINSASREDLMMLPGVGEKTAGRIIEERARVNGFKSLDGLLNVRYISSAKLGAMRAFVTVKRKG